MKNIIVIDDYLLRGISVAENLKEFSDEHPEFDIKDIKILHYCNRPDDKTVNIDTEFDIQNIDLFIFDEVIEKYFDDPNTIILSALLLEDDKYHIPFIQRVNVRFVLLANRFNYGKFWFYDDLLDDPTAALAAKYNLLEYFLPVKETMVSNGRCRLVLQGKDFLEIMGA